MRQMGKKGKFALSLLIIAIIIFLGTIIESNNVTGLTNMTSIAKVYIKNTEPNITKVVINPSNIDLIPGNTTQVNCTASIFEWNGWADINYTNVTLFNTDAALNNDTDDNNYHYTNTSCSCASGGSPYNATCTCSFDVWYYANNGTWMCNFTAGDGEFRSTKNETAYINTVIGVGVPNEIDYGNLSVSETSAFIPTNVSNWGNVPINLSIRGYGGTDPSLPNVDQYSMICELGNISMDYARYSLNTSVTYANMTNLSFLPEGVPGVNLPIRTNDSVYGNDTETTYWKLYIPWSRGGYCNGTVEFLGEETLA